MTTIFSSNYQDFEGNSGKITICSGPVIFNTKNQVLLHISSSTQKYQFIGGRLDDTLSLRKNVVARAEEVLGHKNLTILDNSPLCLLGDIIRDGASEKVLLHHYKSTLSDENNIGTGEWKTLAEIEQLSQEDMLSSPNVLIATKHFLEK